ncbi:MAG: exodeoxyribonuclease V subunit beta [candidate division KSB1 bacterium]|nr:exodeoxyribonuclease V subunit beta [candidate division KSB1 bacterium]MDZ7334088.1 exodeoxyribonuclease V subunit beta [candidate division KSB1 bacterium]MDZ7357071.1 exodeoxyribonuclease V subunit beta [candidate division KSB1 bacterium]MDZ7399576.1 exodeoxyribonuclease V subunit beta [candidate division KSB1 bacterium]
MTAQEFDILNSPLAGTNLIEASAGTGKTYTITGLFLRLVIERALKVNEILVVTFTEAATAELRDRIRKFLRKAVRAFAEQGSDEQFFDQLVQKYGSNRSCMLALRNAIRDFDQAAIFTIHGFCNRMLNENAFESRVLFDTELISQTDHLNQEIVNDFWRKFVYLESPLFVNFALANDSNPSSLLQLVNRRIMSPDFRIIPDDETDNQTLDRSSITQLEFNFQQAWQAVRNSWDSARSEIENLLQNHPNLNRQQYPLNKIPVWLTMMDQTLTSEEDNLTLFPQLKKFTASSIAAGTKKNCQAPQHPFFDLCETLFRSKDQLETIYKKRLISLKIKLFSFWQTELARRKTEKNLQSFDDLLLKLYEALKSPSGNDLAAVIRNKFKAALIDEFQDTDPIQYAIFKAIFHHPDSILFLIGDPKQAIYGFRGADIFAYMDAARQVTNRYTLSCNWRSEPGLITAVNTIFGNCQLPFVFEEISFYPARAADRPDRQWLTIKAHQEPPLQLWVMESNQFVEGDEPIPKTDARQIIYRAVAAEICRLLTLSDQQGVWIGDQPLREMDIAVLVRRNSEAIALQRALASLNIPSVLFSTENLFDSHEALELQRLLESIAQPNDDFKLRVALATDLMGYSGEAIEAAMRDDDLWESWLVQFRNYHELWRRHGFFQMFRQLLIEQQVLPRLMSFPNGERRCTNVLHLAEVLNRVATERNLGMAMLLKWLAEQRDPTVPRLEQHQLRLETDENAVKLVTIHKSKGLEYPIVFCPFSWDGSRIRDSKDFLLFHDEANHRILTLDLGAESRDLNLRQAEKEQLAENLRLLYVALTRAKHRCYLIWGRLNEAESSAPAYLLHQAKGPNFDAIFDATCARFQSLTDEQLFQDLQAIAFRSDQTIQLVEMAEPQITKYQPQRFQLQHLAFQPFQGRIDSSWHISSYSSLVSRISYAAELPDYDPIEPLQLGATIGAVPTGSQAAVDIRSFPRGNKAGIFFHKIFELIDFQDQNLEIAAEIVSDNLQEFGFEPQWHPVILGLIEKVLKLPLDPKQPDFNLSKISLSQRLNELEFYFPVKKIENQKLKQIFEHFAGANISNTWPEQVGRLNFAPFQGFMKGFMDLVFQYDQRFYLVDWKSNFLGDQIEHYHQQRLLPVMEQEFYLLQYLIYTVALDQYLRQRWPGYQYERHFGGVFYIFLRGVEPALGPEYGLFRDRPNSELVRQLSDLLIG